MLSAGLSQRRRDPYSEISRPPKEKKKWSWTRYSVNLRFWFVLKRENVASNHQKCKQTLLVTYKHSALPAMEPVLIANMW